MYIQARIRNILVDLVAALLFSSPRTHKDVLVCIDSVLASFLSAWHRLVVWEEETLIEKCLQKTGLCATLFSWLTDVEGPSLFS